MIHRAFSCSLLFILAVGFCQAQVNGGGSFSNQDGFVFPGEADRPSKFPINPTSSTGSRPRVTTTPTPSTGGNSTPSVADYNQCVDRCQTTSEYNPVCGSDNVVYSNPGRLNCARNCGNAVEFVKYGQCNAGNVRG